MMWYFIIIKIYSIQQIHSSSSIASVIVVVEQEEKERLAAVIIIESTLLPEPSIVVVVARYRELGFVEDSAAALRFLRRLDMMVDCCK